MYLTADADPGWLKPVLSADRETSFGSSKDRLRLFFVSQALELASSPLKLLTVPCSLKSPLLTRLYFSFLIV